MATRLTPRSNRGGPLHDCLKQVVAIAARRLVQECRTSATGTSAARSVSRARAQGWHSVAVLTDELDPDLEMTKLGRHLRCWARRERSCAPCPMDEQNAAATS